jgi:hypothetical protein
MFLGVVDGNADDHPTTPALRWLRLNVTVHHGAQCQLRSDQGKLRFDEGTPSSRIALEPEVPPIGDL